MLKEESRKWLLVAILALFLLLLCWMPALWSRETPERQPMAEESPPVSAIRMQTPVGRIPVVVSGGTLKGTAKNLQALYDGDETTVCGDERATWVTLDLGQHHRLAGVRFLSDAGGGISANRCLGTRFLVADSDGVFRPVATLEAEDGEDLAPGWSEILFDSAGEYQYLRVEIPAGGYFGEIEWLEYSGWSYQPGINPGKQDLFMDFYVSQVQKDTEVTILTAVYNRNGVLTGLKRITESFREGQDATLTVTVPGISGEDGELIRVAAWEKDGTPAIPNPLQYRNNNCAPNLTLSNLFSDYMLLQAGKPLVVWGKGSAGQQVTVTLTNGEDVTVSAQTVVSNDFTWEVDLGSFLPGGSYGMTVESGVERKEYRNITFGDVWLCIGQSNMDYFMFGGQDTESYLTSEQGKKEATNLNIRLLNLWNKGIGGSGGVMENLPLSYGERAWAPMSPDVASYCSAVGYFFAQGLEREYEIPIGLLSVAVGDTEINRWIPGGERYGRFTSTDGGLFHNRVAPFQKLQIRGILMYQGEADQYRTNLTTAEYRDAMAGLVDRYRSIWGEEIPFYWAQLTRYKKDESAVREGQRLALEKIRNKNNAGIISLIDLYGEFESEPGNCREDIHPHQKQEVAERFLRYAKRDVYGEDIPVSGPVYQSMKILGNRVELTFETTGDLTVLPMERYADRVGQEKIKERGIDVSVPGGFEIAGRDGIYHPATATIQGNKVILESTKVPAPFFARYAWGAYPEIPNLTDGTGLPSLSFSTEIYR